MITRLSELFSHRQLLFFLVTRDLQIRYKNSFLGYLWAILDPLFTIATFLFVFSFIFNIRIENYPLFLITGIIPWQFFQKSINDSTMSFVANRQLIQKIYFPRQLIPIYVNLSNFLHIFIGFAIFLIMLLFSKVSINKDIIFIPFVIFFQLIFNVGLSLILATFNVFFRDIAYITRFVLNLWFYATPIFYSIEMVPERIYNFYLLNPMVTFVSTYRYLLFTSEGPPIWAIAMTGIVSICLLVVSFWIFSSFEGKLLKRV